ncbi:hypothetical protein [Pseudomonas sp. 2FE]|uniref:hypothetical protein n=1 Tax=Pseudomonas sp. 2FE TaxID=2502190 RepID=UPI0014856371|nr:hypothetical protein [Pseudomonas sp. 2FE]
MTPNDWLHETAEELHGNLPWFALALIGLYIAVLHAVNERRASHAAPLGGDDDHRVGGFQLLRVEAPGAAIFTGD